MSFAAEKCAWEHKCKNSTEKAVLICLAWFANREGDNAFPSLETICRFTQFADKSVRKALRGLTDDKVVERELQFDDNGGCQPSRYRLLVGFSTPEDLDTVPPVDQTNTPPVDLRQHSVDRQEGDPKKTAESRGGPVNVQGNLEVSKKEGSKEGKKETSLREAKKETRIKDRSRIREDWEPDEKGRTYAAQRGVPDHEISGFRNYHAGKGNLMADWNAAWRTWCDNAVRYGTATGKPIRRTEAEVLFNGWKPTPMVGGLS